MLQVKPCPLPPDALLRICKQQGAYVDCFAVDIAMAVSQVQFVEAFYTSAVFRVERWILRWALSRPSTDLQARQLAEASIDAFAAWTVQPRSADQLLLADIAGSTRSWLMVEPGRSGAEGATRLYFGSAVMPKSGSSAARPEMAFLFRALLGFHKLYSRVLLGAARSRLMRGRA